MMALALAGWSTPWLVAGLVWLLLAWPIKGRSGWFFRVGTVLLVASVVLEVVLGTLGLVGGPTLSADLRVAVGGAGVGIGVLGRLAGLAIVLGGFVVLGAREPSPEP